MSGARGSTLVKGRWAEGVAESQLVREGLSVVGRNVHFGATELDLIAREDIDGEAWIVFVEVRSRSDAGLGHPVETIDLRKRSQIRSGARHWLVREGLADRVFVRFDVITILGNPAGYACEWFRDAFRDE